MEDYMTQTRPDILVVTRAVVTKMTIYKKQSFLWQGCKWYRDCIVAVLMEGGNEKCTDNIRVIS